MDAYLCYDLKGIQQHIFQIPNLKCCVGGSRQVDSFDRQDAAALTIPGVKKIFTGGGKGAFSCATHDAVAALRRELVVRAHQKGLTIRFGIHKDYTVAAREISETYCYQPESLAGQPCSVSGLYPTEEPNGIHPLIQARMNLGGRHDQASPVEREFLNSIRRRCGRENLFFFYNVDADDKDGIEGAEALGLRNRWAVIRMDGNDMGSQFLTFLKNHPATEANAVADWEKWLPEMSCCLDKCTREAARDGMLEVAGKYLEENPENMTLPIRPLIVGGDDITILTGCGYATLFVSTVMRKFQEYSKQYSSLWCGTSGELSISAGILYAPVALPIHSAIEYAEMLLANAKTRGRALKKTSASCPVPCFDWESVTEGLLETPAARRSREFRFYDQDIKRQVELTERPYSLEWFEHVDRQFRPMLKKLPGGIQYQIHPHLLGPLEKRLAFYARIRKNHPDLATALMEQPVRNGAAGASGPAWHVDGEKQTTPLIDLLLCIQEEKRAENPTVNPEEDIYD